MGPVEIRTKQTRRAALSGPRWLHSAMIKQSGAMRLIHLSPASGIWVNAASPAAESLTGRTMAEHNARSSHWGPYPAAAEVVKLVDTHVSGTCEATRGGSSPLLGTTIFSPLILSRPLGQRFAPLRTLFDAPVCFNSDNSIAAQAAPFARHRPDHHTPVTRTDASELWFRHGQDR